MVSISSRMRNLRTVRYFHKAIAQVENLLHIRLGPGAARLPPDIKRINLAFAFKNKDGHMGARQFWRHCLPRLKYHNPGVSMTIQRSENTDTPSLMTIFYTSPSPSSSTTTSTSKQESPPTPVPDTTTSSSPESPPATSPPSSTSTSTSTSTTNKPSDHTPSSRVETIEMKNRHSDDIWKDFLALTKATQVVATPAEEAELEQLSGDRTRAEQDRRRELARREAIRAEAALLEAARGATSMEN
ncbi:hypothetical protein MMC25_008236 [Agyrium rufum]|nr:hypothetical protein [Agyrium rufum]